MNLVKSVKYLAALPAVVAAGAYAEPSSLANNAITALETAKADGESVGAKVIAAVVVVVGLSLVIALIRKV